MTTIFPGEISPNSDEFCALTLPEQTEAIINMLIVRRQRIIQTKSFDTAWMCLGFLISYLEEIQRKDQRNEA